MLLRPPVSYTLIRHLCHTALCICLKIDTTIVSVYLKLSWLTFPVHQP